MINKVETRKEAEIETLHKLVIPKCHIETLNKWLIIINFKEMAHNNQH